MQNFEEFDRIFKISELVVKHIREELSVDERQQLENWLNSDVGNKALLDKLVDEQKLKIEAEYFFGKNNKEQAWQNIIERKEQVDRYKPSYWLITKYAAAVAFIVLSVMAVLKFRLSSVDTGSGEKSLAKVEPAEIYPGGNKAVLTLADGSHIVLDSLANGNVAEQYGSIIKKTKEGQIIYDLSSLSSKKTNNEIVYNIISTPKGGEYQLILPDGTKVWLNSMSSLRFPVTFSGKERRVELIGEGYFEVAKDKTKPFYVKAKDMEIRVLGTHFNISSFADESQIKTTLLEGSVKINRGNKEAILTPGQEAVAYNGKSGFTTQDADIEQTMAWRNGYFLFRDESIESLMRRISRWYNVEIAYEDNLEGKTFGGKFSKNSTLSELLKSLELTGTVKFKMHERRVTVMQ
ncbi:FecR domain-containing protein [Pseudopedobacter sp.]|uniref:FecR family protein n=1 Tax=Pseudopedobacter sp. TaxID=1936787 RepID=UPI0033411201